MGDVYLVIIWYTIRPFLFVQELDGIHMVVRLCTAAASDLQLHHDLPQFLGTLSPCRLLCTMSS